MSGPSPPDLYLSPDEQNLLVAALNSNQQDSTHRGSGSQDSKYTPMTQTEPGSAQMAFSDDSPYLDFDPDGEFDDSAFDFDPNARMIGDIPGDDDRDTGDLHDKRKSIDGKDEDDEGGGKRREGEDRISKKPGRKPLMSEPTSKRKAQNRAAQRAFRERKERHLKDLETKVDDLEKTSEARNHENGLLRAKLERLEVEVKEYRKRLSWIGTSGVDKSPISMLGSQQRSNSSKNRNDFQFEFPKFGDLPPMPATNLFNGGNQKPSGPNTTRSSTMPIQNGNSMRSIGNKISTSRSNSQTQPQRQSSLSESPLSNGNIASPQSQSQPREHQGSVDSLSGLFSPSILEASRHGSFGSYFTQTNTIMAQSGNTFSNSSISNTDSPGSSSESHNPISSIGTSPEPSLNSPVNKLQDFGLSTISGNQASLFGYGNTPGFHANNFNFLAQQNNGGFDPVLFGDYREAQDNVLSQDFGNFINDAYPLPDLGSPSHNFSDISAEQVSVPVPTRLDLMKQVEAAKEGDEEVVPNTDKPMTCNKIWDRLQSMEKFRNGEIDIDNLCSELRAKAKCSEGGAVVDKKDVDKILGHAK